MKVTGKVFRGYSHCGGTPIVSPKEGQRKNFEKYPQMVVSFYKNPQMEFHKPENWVAFNNANFLQFFIICYCKIDGTKQENFKIYLQLILSGLK